VCPYLSDPSRLAYFVPEFPGVTHTFFVRELAALKTLGCRPLLFSTRRPPTPMVPASGASLPPVNYLMPLSGRSVIEAVRQIRCTPVKALANIASIVFHAPNAGFRERLRLPALALLGLVLAHRLREQSVSHIHSQFVYDGATVVMFASIAAQIPYSIGWHGSAYHYGLQREKWRRARFGTVVSNHGLNELKATVGADVLPCLHLAPMGVDARRFRRHRKYHPFDGSGAFRIFSCGRLTPAKGHLDLIDAVATLRDRGINCELRIAGNATQPGAAFVREIDERIRAREIGSVVTLLGPLAEDAVIDELDAAHAFALASHEESLGIAYAEAMAMELPVVGTTVGGVPELIQSGVHGLLVEPRDIAALASALSTIARSPAMAIRLGEAGRRRVANEFSSERSAAVLLSALAEARS